MSGMSDIPASVPIILVAALVLVTILQGKPEAKNGALVVMVVYAMVLWWLSTHPPPLEQLYHAPQQDQPQLAVPSSYSVGEALYTKDPRTWTHDTNKLVYEHTAAIGQDGNPSMQRLHTARVNMMKAQMAHLPKKKVDPYLRPV
jgi:hypothetical protein